MLALMSQLSPLLLLPLHVPHPLQRALRSAPLVAVLVLLSGCQSCRPQLPSGDDADTRTDSATPPDSNDSGETGDPVDTGPQLPPRCDHMEVESNNSLDLSEPITMEQWWCGSFEGDGALGDTEFLNFSPLQTGWLSVAVEAAARSSLADAQLLLSDDNGHAVFVYDGVSTGAASSDPSMVVPADQLGNYTVVVAETGYLTGEGYDWALMASLVKPPVVWDFQESEDNDVSAEANAFELGEVVFGKMDSTADRDWYRVVVPDGLQSVHFNVEAYGSGSPANIQITVYDAASGARKFISYHGVIDYDLDPDYEQKVTAATEWTVLVEDEFDSGSSFNWYTLKIVGVPAE